MNPPRRDISPTHSWPTRARDRRLIYSPKAFRSWPVTLPAAFGDSGAAEKTSDWMNLSKPYPVGSALWAVPGCALSLETMGALEAQAEFWGPAVYLSGTTDPDDGTGSDGDYYLNTDAMEYWGPKGDSTEGSWHSTGPTALPSGTWLFGGGAPGDSLGDPGDYYFDWKASAYYGPKGATSWSGTGPTSLPDPGEALITRADLQTLTIPSATPTPYAIGSTGNAAPPYSPFGWTPTTGTFYGDWSALAVAIPAGTGKIFGVSSYCNAGPWWNGLLTPPYDQMVTYTAHLELGDASSNVVGSAEVATHHYEHNLTGYDGGGVPIYEHVQTVAAAFVAGQAITLTGIATKKRCKMVISAIRYAEPYCRIETGGYVEM